MTMLRPTSEGPFLLLGRGVLALSGMNENADPGSWLANLVTNDLAPHQIGQNGPMFAALLSPQGKIQFEFFAFTDGRRVLLDVMRGEIAAFSKRLGLYRLRAPIAITDASDDYRVAWSHAPNAPDGAIAGPDPRAPDALWRMLVLRADAAGLAVTGPYAQARVSLGIGEAPDDYALGDTFPHEANYDRLGGVSFTKGCYVGQEVVARMQNKGVVRKRVVRIASTDGRALTSGADVAAGAATLGRVGTVAGSEALALLRLDRALEAVRAGTPLLAADAPISIDHGALDAFERARASRPVIDL